MSSSHETAPRPSVSAHTDLNPSANISHPENDGTQQAQAFLEQRGGALHPALNPRALTQQLESKEKDGPCPYIFKTSLNEHTKEFIKAVEAYKNGWQDPRVRALSLYGKISWEQVMQEVREAEERYNLAGENPIRRLARRTTDKSAAVLPFLRMLPNETLWLPAVGGALRLVFEAFGKISEKRAYILGFLVRIPDIIIQTEDTCVNFGPDPALYAKAEKVFIAVLAAIEGTIKWLNMKVLGEVYRVPSGPEIVVRLHRTHRTQWHSGTVRRSSHDIMHLNNSGKPFTAIGLGPLYSKSFKDKLNDLDDTLNALETYVSPMRDKFTANTNKGVQHLEEQMENLEQLQQASKTAIDKMMEVLADTNRTAKWMREKDVQIRRLKLRVEEFERAASALNATELADILAIPDSHPDNDLQYILQRIGDNCDEFELAFKVNTGEVFKQWQAEDDSPPLFIEGGLPVSSRRSTALSIVSSTLVKSIQNIPRATSIYFFCGMHDNLQDSISGPQGIVRSLISQVLREFDVNLDFISMLARPLIEKLNLRALCDCFGKLVKQLPAKVVLFCVIDGISFFETTLWANDTAKVIGDLRDLAYDSETGATFKLLVTSPRRSRFVASIFEPETRLNISPTDVRRNGSEREVMLATRRTSQPQMSARPSLRTTLRPHYQSEGARQNSLEQKTSYDSLSDMDL